MSDLNAGVSALRVSQDHTDGHKFLEMHVCVLKACTCSLRMMCSH